MVNRITGITPDELREELKKQPSRNYLSIETLDREIAKDWENISARLQEYDIKTTTQLRSLTSSTTILDILVDIYIKNFPDRDRGAPLDPSGIITWGLYLLANGISPNRVNYVAWRVGRSSEHNKYLIVTATKVEAQAVLEVFAQAAGTPCITQDIGGKLYNFLGVHGEVQVLMVQSEPGTATIGGALPTVQQFIQALKPKAVIGCGIAFGLRPENPQQLGDILISKQIYCYEPQKVDIHRGKLPRGDKVTVSPTLLNHFHHGDLYWKGATTHFGLLVTGEKLANDPEFRDALLKAEPEAIGGEMEACGLYIAASAAKVDWIVIKAICDWGDGNKDDKAQKLAAQNAAEFVLHVLQQGGWIES